GDQKPKAGIWLRRMQHQAHGRTTVHPRASQLNFMSDSGLARPYKSPGHVSLDPLIGPGRRPFQRPVPPKIPPQLPVFYETWSFFALTLDRRLNLTILECADWGQITVSYTVLPLRRSFGTGPAPRLSTAFATPKKHRQINLIIERWARLRGAHGALLAPTTGRLGEPPQQSECAGVGRGMWLLVHAAPLRLGRGAPLAAAGAVELLCVRWKILKCGKAVALVARSGGPLRRLSAGKPRRSLLDHDAARAFPGRHRR